MNIKNTNGYIMSDKPSLEEVIANNTNIEPEHYSTKIQRKKFEFDLDGYLIQHFKFSTLARYLEPLHFDYKTLVNNLQPISSFFLNRFGTVYPVPEIPSADVDDPGNSDPKIKQIFDEFPFFKFGGVPFVCSHDYLWQTRSGQNGQDKDIFEIRYGIKLSDVYISLNELQSVAAFNSIFSIIDDFVVTGNYNNTVLTIIDNDLPYGAKGSFEKYECHFKPIFCIDQGIPVKYIKTVSDTGTLYSHKYASEQRHEYTMQRKHTLKRLGEFYKTNNLKASYPTDIDFIVKTGLHEFTFLGYDRFSNQGDFFVTNVIYDDNNDNFKYTIKKCNFTQMPQQINAIQYARAMHFNKIYGSKTR